jgi:hypothetical protein
MLTQNNPKIINAFDGLESSYKLNDFDSISLKKL